MESRLLLYRDVDQLAAEVNGCKDTLRCVESRSQPALSQQQSNYAQRLGPRRPHIAPKHYRKEGSLAT